MLTLPNDSTISDGMGAIRLEPSGASSSTQALLIYPTAGDGGNHIHLTAGGGETDLYLGSDIQYVKVDHGGSIVIGAVGANTSTWTFGTDGVLTLPNGMIIDSYGTSGVNAFVDIGGDNTRISIDNDGAPPGFSVTTNAAVTARTWRFGPDGELTFPQGSTISETTGTTGTHATTIIQAGIQKDLLLKTEDYVNSTLRTWTFGIDGVLTLSTASTILGSGTDPNVYIETVTTSTTSTWTFGTDGVLTLPAATPVIKGGGTGTDVTVIASTGSNTSTWVFGANGSVTFPDATVQRTAYLTGQQTVLVNAASTGTAIELTELTGTVIWVDAEPGYSVPSETHYLVLPYQDNPVNPNIPLGTRITVINNYSGTVAVRGWPGGPFSEYQMANGESIDLVYHYNFNYGGNLWWITNTFNW